MEENQEEVKSEKTVTVGCKLPHGLWMELQLPGKPKVKILARGCNSSEVIGGFGLTQNVPKDFWDEWHRQHQNMKFVRDEKIWCYSTSGGARKKAMEMAEIRHGMEPLNTDKLPAGLQPGSLTE